MTFMEHNTNAVLLSASCRSPVTGMGPLGAVLYCIDGVVIAAQYTANFYDLLCSPEFRYYYDVNTPIKFWSEANFSGLRFSNEP